MWPWTKGRAAENGPETVGARVSALRYRLRIVVVAGIGSVLVLAGGACWNAWSVESQIADRRIESVLAAKERFSRLVFGTLERLLAGVIADQHVADIETLAPLIDALAASEILEVRTIIVTDERGGIIGDTRKGKPGVGIDVSDRPYFFEQRDGTVPPEATYFGGLVRSRADGRWSFPLSRAMVRPDGSFAGVVVTSFGVHELNAAFGEMLEDRADLGSLLMTLRGHVIAFPSAPEAVGKTLANSRILAAAREGDKGTLAWLSPIDGRDWTVHWKRLDPLPFIVAVGIDRASMIRDAAWRASGWIVFAMVASMILGFGGWALLRMARQADMVRERAEHARMQAENSDRLKTEFLAQLSHEIRTPLNAIVGFSEAIALDVLKLGIDSRYQTYASHVHGASQILLGHVNDLLNMSDVIRGVVQLESENTSLNGLLTESVRLMANQAARRGIGLEVETVPETIMVDVDRRRIIQVITNLISNSIKYSPAGSTVDITCRTGKDGAEIGILDRGPGLPPDRVQEAMQPFARLSNPRVTKAGGIGLGLPIAAGLARAHGGSLSILAREGGGTHAHLRVPPERVSIVELERRAD